MQVTTIFKCKTLTPEADWTLKENSTRPVRQGVPHGNPVMAFSGRPNPEDSYLDFSLTSNSPYSPILETSSLESGSPSPVPRSSRKKRVRISDSTSVRVIEKRGDLSHFRMKDKHNINRFKAKALRFSHRSRFSDRLEKERLLGAGEYEGECMEEVYRRECGRSAVEYLEDRVTFSPDLLYRTER